MDSGIILIGYSGHALVAYECLASMGNKVIGYCEEKEKAENPFKLKYLGFEKTKKGLSLLKKQRYFIGIGNNGLRKNIQCYLMDNLKIPPVNAVHSSAKISPSSKIGMGVLVAPNAVINATANVEDGVICNTSSIIEHGCTIGKFSHIAPGATICGNVRIGEDSFIGANSVIKENINIGKGVLVGAGSVVINDIPDNSRVAGNPTRFL